MKEGGKRMGRRSHKKDLEKRIKKVKHLASRLKDCNDPSLATSFYRKFDDTFKGTHHLAGVYSALGL